jgi:hypothetical protein
MLVGAAIAAVCMLVGWVLGLGGYAAGLEAKARQADDKADKAGTGKPKS